MVGQVPLEHFVQVRILAAQPELSGQRKLHRFRVRSATYVSPAASLGVKMLADIKQYLKSEIALQSWGQFRVFHAI
jgi:hypothetical protein